jgi:tRNA A-37 threonylcarbamoyl transferase component Bud32
MSIPLLTEKTATAADLVHVGHESRPFMLALDGVNGSDALLHCREIIRVLPGRRLVCRGEWRGQEAFIKLYLGRNRHWRSELDGLAALQAAGIPAPRIVHGGTADAGAIHVILLEPVCPAVTFATAWQSAQDEPARIRLLEQAALTIARHHRAGLEQRDIHLDNFLLAGNRLYTLDGGGIRVTGQAELSPGQSRDNLALFLAQFYPHFDHLAPAALVTYRGERGWAGDVITTAELWQRIWHFRHRRRRQFLKKVFRNCTAFACERSWRHFLVYDRSMASPEMRAFLSDPDASSRFPDMRYLKQGNTCTLWLARVGGRQYVVKRYNIKSLLHRFGRAFRRTRAAVSWANAHRLGIYGIATARPVALLEQRLGPLRGRAWYISEYVAGKDVMQLCQQPVPAVARQVLALLEELALCRISHGDMKGNNIILSEQGPVIIDLDAMHEHVSDRRYRRMRRRDLQRFMRNWEDGPETAGFFRKALFPDDLSRE